MITYLYVKTHNKTGLKYLGKTTAKDPHKYSGSGKYWKNHLNKHGFDYTTEILKECQTKEELRYWGEHYSNLWKVTESDDWANLKPESGDGGDNSKFIPYDKIDYSNYQFQGAKRWYASLTQEQKTDLYARQASSRSKGWYVSKVDDPTEEFVLNIAKWCKEHNLNPSTPSKLNNPNDPMFQKQAKGWRIRRSDMPALPSMNSIIDKRKVGHPNDACKGRTWKIVDGKRIWSDK